MAMSAMTTRRKELANLEEAMACHPDASRTELDGATHARSTPSSTKLTESFVSSRIRTRGCAMM